jgi:hypothetical protein
VLYYWTQELWSAVHSFNSHENCNHAKCRLSLTMLDEFFREWHDCVLRFYAKGLFVNVMPVHMSKY